MNVFDHINLNYNYYPRTCIELSILAYEWESEIGKLVSNKTNLALCWGPVEFSGILDIFPYAKMFVAKNESTNEYFVAIQGTNPFSLEAWGKEDFDVGTSQPFSDLLPPYLTNPLPPALLRTENALLSQGTFNGVNFLKDLVCRKTKQNLVEFLAAEQPSYIYVTGHSLGGTLTPVFFAYINALVYGGAPITNMALWSFAGLTPGGAGFNDYFNSLIPNNQDFLWRIQNSLDVAPTLWDSLSDALDIYEENKLVCTNPWFDRIEKLFNEANDSGVGYTQPQTGLVISGQFQPGLSWYDEASHQHSSLTYRDLVGEYYKLNY